MLESNNQSIHRDPPWAAGIKAARANFIPGLIVQVMLLSIVIAYYFYPPVQSSLNSLAEIRLRIGYSYAAISSIIAGAIIPELLRIFIFQKGRIQSANFSNLMFSAPLWCFFGVIGDLFFRYQSVWFGQEATFSVVVKKVLVDQFLFVPFFASPVQTWLYDWKSRNFTTRGIFENFTFRYYQESVVPTMVANWGVWFPLTAIIYSLPTALQIPLFGLALTLWVMLLTWMSEQRGKTSPPSMATQPSMI